MITWVNPSPQPKRHLGRFSRFCTDDHRVSLFFTMGRPFAPSKFPSHGGSEPHLIHGSLGPPESSTQIDRFSHFAGLTSVTDRPTDQATRSVTVDRVYVRSTAMRSKNGEKQLHEWIVNMCHSTILHAYIICQSHL